MKFAIVEPNDLPKPHLRYAQMAASFRAAGVNIENDEFEKIDAILNGEKWNDPASRRNRTKQDSKEIDPIDLFSAEALQHSGCVSSDTPYPDLLIEGYLPQTKPFLMN